MGTPGHRNPDWAAGPVFSPAVPHSEKAEESAGTDHWLWMVMILALETAWNLMLNFGLVFMSTAGLPFFTYGGYHTMAVYGLLGILLSIYRYQDLIWEKNPEKEDYNVLARLGRYRIRIEKMDV